MLSLLPECVLKGAVWLYSIAGLYPFNKLLSFSDIHYTLFDVYIVCDKWWFHYIFKDAEGKSFKEEGNGFSILYDVTSLSS